MAALNVLENFVAVVHERDTTLRQGSATKVGSLHCPTCSDSRKMILRKWWRMNERQPLKTSTDKSYIAAQLAPSLHQLTCVECEGIFTALIFPGPQGPELAIFPNKAGGLATKNTPREVAYYLDQAWRCQCVSALSAAVVMYRSALEHLLHQQGYEKGMLDAKIKALEKDIADGKGPGWVRSAPPQLLGHVKNLGNGAAHTNGGEIAKQAAFDAAFVEFLRAVMGGLLDAVYEQPVREQEVLNKLQATAQVFEKKTK
jgi:hypothetical protein